MTADSRQRTVLKEWIYTEEPNMPAGSKYSCNISGAQNVRQDDEGRVHVSSQERSYVIDPVVYWTQDDVQHTANWQVTTPTPGVEVLIHAKAEDYPLLIDLKVNYGQWLGGVSTDSVLALDVTADEIYAGGYSNYSTSWEAVTFQGAHSGGSEGFVVEIADGAAAGGGSTHDVMFFDPMF